MASCRSWLAGAGLALGAALMLIAPGGAGVLDASWTAPTTNADGSRLTNLATYRLYFGAASTPCPGPSFFELASQTASPLPNETVTFRLRGLPTGRRHSVSVTAVNTGGNESVCSTAASALPQVDIAVMPTGPLNFGSVNVGSFTDRSFIVQNTRGGSVSGTASIVAPFRVVAGSPFTLVGHGATQVVIVRFSPAAAFTATANVDFSADGDTLSRLVTGSGVGRDRSPRDRPRLGAVSPTVSP